MLLNRVLTIKFVIIGYIGFSRDILLNLPVPFILHQTILGIFYILPLPYIDIQLLTYILVDFSSSTTIYKTYARFLQHNLPPPIRDAAFSEEKSSSISLSLSLTVYDFAYPQKSLFRCVR